MRCGPCIRIRHEDNAIPLEWREKTNSPLAFLDYLAILYLMVRQVVFKCDYGLLRKATVFQFRHLLEGLVDLLREVTDL